MSLAPSLCEYVLLPRRSLGEASARPRQLRSVGDERYGKSESAQLFNTLWEDNGLDKRVQGEFLKGSFLASLSDSFLETELGASLVSTARTARAGL